jgi:arginine deiminase
LEDFAEKCFNYKYVAPLTYDDLTKEEKTFFTSEYKRSSLRKMTVTQLVDIIMCRPTVLVQRDNTHIVSNIVEMSPSTNLTFTRDQQITTARGVVVGNMSASQRVYIIYFCFVFTFFLKYRL